MSKQAVQLAVQEGVPLLVQAMQPRYLPPLTSDRADQGMATFTDRGFPGMFGVVNGIATEIRRYESHLPY